MDFKAVAEQLRKPDGEFGKQVGAKMNDGNWHINRYTLDALNLKPNDNLLELGMGNGFFVKEIFAAENTVGYTGCDFSETMVEEALRLNEVFVKAGQAEFILASGANLPFPDETFDTVFTVNTLYFWTNPAQELAEIRRVLKPEGTLLLAIRPGSVMKNLPFTSYGFRLYEKEEVAELLIMNGYTVVDFIEKKEPEQTMNGAVVPMETLLVRAVKA
jgi:ubiquinone/menaquinone biosynthesis C-methylase UbiE